MPGACQGACLALDTAALQAYILLEREIMSNEHRHTRASAGTLTAVRCMCHVMCFRRCGLEHASAVRSPVQPWWQLQQISTRCCSLSLMIEGNAPMAADDA